MCDYFKFALNINLLGTNINSCIEHFICHFRLLIAYTKNIISGSISIIYSRQRASDKYQLCMLKHVKNELLVIVDMSVYQTIITV